MIGLLSYVAAVFNREAAQLAVLLKVVSSFHLAQFDWKENLSADIKTDGIMQKARFRFFLNEHRLFTLKRAPNMFSIFDDALNYFDGCRGTTRQSADWVVKGSNPTYPSDRFSSHAHTNFTSSCNDTDNSLAGIGVCEVLLNLDGTHTIIIVYV